MAAELAVQFNAPEDRRIYNTLAMLVWCIKTISPDTTWPKRMHALLSARTAVELKAMGAPSDWTSRSTWWLRPTLTTGLMTAGQGIDVTKNRKG
jgi:hypothetical protein